MKTTPENTLVAVGVACVLAVQLLAIWNKSRISDAFMKRAIERQVFTYYFDVYAAGHLAQCKSGDTLLVEAWSSDGMNTGVIYSGVCP